MDFYLAIKWDWRGRGSTLYTGAVISVWYCIQSVTMTSESWFWSSLQVDCVAICVRFCVVRCHIICGSLHRCCWMRLGIVAVILASSLISPTLHATTTRRFFIIKFCIYFVRVTMDLVTRDEKPGTHFRSQSFAFGKHQTWIFGLCCMCQWHSISMSSTLKNCCASKMLSVCGGAN